MRVLPRLVVLGLPLLALSVLWLVPFGATAYQPDWNRVGSSGNRCVAAVVVPPSQTACAAWVCVAPITNGSPGNYCENLALYSLGTRIIMEIVAAPTIEGQNDFWTIKPSLTINGGSPEPCGDKTFTITNPAVPPVPLCARDVSLRDLIEGNRLIDSTHLAPSQVTTGVWGTLKIYFGCDYHDDPVCVLQLD